MTKRTIETIFCIRLRLQNHIFPVTLSWNILNILNRESTISSIVPRVFYREIIYKNTEDWKKKKEKRVWRGEWRLPRPGWTLGDEIISGEDKLVDAEDAFLFEGGYRAGARHSLHRPLESLVDFLRKHHHSPKFAWTLIRIGIRRNPADGSDELKKDAPSHLCKSLCGRNLTSNNTDFPVFYNNN